MIPELLELAEEMLSEVGVAIPLRRASYFLYTNSGEKHSSLLLFLFPKAGRAQRNLVIKIGHDPGRLEAEWKHLRELHPILGGMVPRAWGLGSLNRYTFLILDAVPGCAPRTVPLEHALEVLLEVHTRVRTRRPLRGREKESILARALDSNLTEDAPARVRKAVAAHQASIRETVEQLDVEAIPQHGDFSPPNLIEHDGRFTVIDWESYSLIQLPFYDLFSLFLSIHMGKGEPYVTRLAREPTLRERLGTAIRSYARALDLDVALGRKLFPSCLLLFASLSREEGRSITDSVAREIEALFSEGSPSAHPLFLELG